MSDVVVTVNISRNKIVQFSKKHIMDKFVFLTIPRGYQVYGYVDGRLVYRENEQCNKKRVFDSLGKENIGKEIQFAFFSPNILPEINYGFGPVNVNNERLKEAYRVGINGIMIIEIINYGNLINSFYGMETITQDDIRERILTVIKSVGRVVIGEMFAKSDVSVFEIDSKIGEIRQSMLDRLGKEKTIVDLGIEIKEITVNEIFVNPNDLEIIRNRINS